jgi:ketosteroid isomerase-like protein
MGRGARAAAATWVAVCSIAMKRRILLTFLMVSMAGFAADLRTEVLAAEDAWIAGIKAKDAQALGRVLADDLVYVHSGGVVDTKAQYIAKVTSGKQVYKGVEQFRMKIRGEGAVAVAQYWARMRGINAAGDFDDKLVVAHIWVKTGGVWRMAYHQTTKVPEIPQ